MPCFPVTKDDSTRWFSCLDKSDARDILVIVSLVTFTALYLTGLCWTGLHAHQLRNFALISVGGPLALGSGALAMIASQSGEKEG